MGNFQITGGFGDDLFFVVSGAGNTSTLTGGQGADRFDIELARFVFLPGNQFSTRVQFGEVEILDFDPAAGDTLRFIEDPERGITTFESVLDMASENDGDTIFDFGEYGRLILRDVALSEIDINAIEVFDLTPSNMIVSREADGFVVEGTDGRDFIFGRADSDTLRGGESADIIAGNFFAFANDDSADLIEGQDGDDSFVGLRGNEHRWMEEMVRISLSLILVN